MVDKTQAQTATPNPETTTSTPTAQAPQKQKVPKNSARSKKKPDSDEKVVWTISVSAAFKKRADLASRGVEEAPGDYVENRLAAQVERDLTKVFSALTEKS